jgi:hypothetical protein
MRMHNFNSFIIFLILFIIDIDSFVLQPMRLSFNLRQLCFVHLLIAKISVGCCWVRFNCNSTVNLEYFRVV